MTIAALMGNNPMVSQTEDPGLAQPSSTYGQLEAQNNPWVAALMGGQYNPIYAPYMYAQQAAGAPMMNMAGNVMQPGQQQQGSQA